MTRAAVYLRISLDRSGEGLAVDRQREDCLALARMRGWVVVGEYVDESVSASNRKVSRPGYEAMRRDFDAGVFDAIVCWDLDRLTRQPRQLEDWIEAAEDRGLKLVTANGEADLSTDGGRMFARIKASVARAEIERKGARQVRANRQRAESGRMSSFKPCLGYTSMNEVVPAEAEIVRALFDRFAAGETIYSLRQWLATVARPKQGDSWAFSTVRGMLTNPRYAARVVYRGEVTATPGDWEAIVPDATFDAVQAILTDPRRKTNRVGTERRHLLSGIARCGVCGARVRGRNLAYFCPDGCVTKARQQTDQLVLGVIERVLAQSDWSELASSPADPALDGRARELRARLAQIEKDYDDGLIDGRRFQTASEKVGAELRAVDKQRLGNTGRAALSQIVEAPDVVAAFRTAPLSVRRSVIEALLVVKVLKRSSHGAGLFDPESVGLEWVGALGTEVAA